MQLFHPEQPHSAFVQGVWSVTVAESLPNPVVKPLYSDAGSGVIFNLNGNIMMGQTLFSEGVIMLPVRKQADVISLPPGAKLAGIRFHPGIGFGVLGKCYDQPALLQKKDDTSFAFYSLLETLRQRNNNHSRIAALRHWLAFNMNFTDVMPVALEKVFSSIGQETKLGLIGQQSNLSQRQIERVIKTRLGMTPKHFQRVLRIKKTIQFLRTNKQADLADVAVQFGFSDQAHMTREFRSIAGATPSQVRRGSDSHTP
ncbi:helix-turn-helix domain-containing protein [Flocculibacter collagenilyticus]|uniref:helix-turn-helix domain-containing protein n=1 Tax=Flocculibacter collagenilyticus TaxID=2744479 RepID=UPI001F205841|nr:helix-turn-helix domain-containing protein [Flocculibacter collagenilyticus]